MLRPNEIQQYIDTWTHEAIHGCANQKLSFEFTNELIHEVSHIIKQYKVVLHFGFVWSGPLRHATHRNAAHEHMAVLSCISCHTDTEMLSSFWSFCMLLSQIVTIWACVLDWCALPLPQRPAARGSRFAPVLRDTRWWPPRLREILAHGVTPWHRPDFKVKRRTLPNLSESNMI